MLNLDPLTCPLFDRQLIEASAGTGKTYTIALLFVRLLLERRLEVDQILVVTFTEAATQELRSRIRDRLRKALDLLRHQSPDADAILATLLAPYLDDAESQSRLADALVRMDEAAIHTIHGFCARVLQDHAFDTGMAFELEMIGSDDELALKLMRDYWRIQIASLSREELEWLVGRWPTPEALLASLGTLLKQPQLQILPQITLDEVRKRKEDLANLHRQLAQSWQRVEKEITDILVNSPALKRNSYRKDVVARALGVMAELSSTTQVPETLAKHLERFTPAMLEEQTKPGHNPPDHAFFDQVADFMAAHAQTMALREPAWLQEALKWLRDSLTKHKAERHQLAYNDLISRLAEALGCNDSLSERLASQLRNRYRVALIDEFQDTDVQQYLIFKRIYSAPDTGLLMIGDPKQAIYSFRGGDIFAYLKARADTDKTRRYNLDTNWRSSAGLVQAVNSLFGRKGVEQPFALEEGLDFIQVKHAPEAEKKHLSLNGTAQPPLTFWLLEGLHETGNSRTKEELKEDAAIAAANYVVRLLKATTQGQALVDGEPLKAQDIAILVRTHGEGTLMREALAERGVVAVNKNKTRIFETEEAQYLHLLLKTLANPANEAQLRLFLVSPLMGLTLAQAQTIMASEEDWDALQQKLIQCRERWQQQGFMAAFLSLMHQLGLPTRLLAEDQGERRLTNLLQLAEVLQNAAREQTSIEALLYWYARQLSFPDADDAFELRLESDESLVRIVTIHASKGLEYPVVLLPFAFLWEETAKDCQFHKDGGYFKAMAGSASDNDKAQAKQERLSERLRLLYVAITRARSQCLVFWGNMAAKSEPPALAWLLHQSGTPPQASIPGTLSEVRTAIETLAQDCDQSIGISNWPAPGIDSYSPPPLDMSRLSASVPQNTIQDDWRLSSYSGLIRHLDQARQTQAETGAQDHDIADLQDPTARLQPSPTEPSTFSFPRGPHIGSFLHSLLEVSDFQQPDPKLIEEQRKRFGIEAKWQEVLETWLADILNTPLNNQGLRLTDIGPNDRLNEIAFHYPVENLSARDFKALLKTNANYAREAEGLNFPKLRGLMHGFIDLVIRDGQGRFYILDYKSNHLGNRQQDYDQTAMEAAMDQHQYRLQYLIYSLGLHRYLGQRLPNYDYGQHFGGVYYLFLRGMAPGSRTGIYRDQPSLEFLENMDGLMRGRKAA